MSSIVQKIDFSIGNAKIEIVLQGGFTELGIRKSTPMHFHPNYEIHYIDTGTFSFRYSDTQVEVEKDSLIIIPQKQYHAFESQSADLKRLSFELRLTELKTGSPLFDEYNTLLSWLDAPLIKKGFSPEFSALVEYMGVIEGDEDICKINALFVLAFLKICDYLRLLTKSRQKKTKASAVALQSDSELTVIRIIGYISSNCNRQLKLSEVAKAVNVSERQLQRILSQRLGESFTSILAKSRINLAKDIIDSSESSQTLEVVAYECGFSNYVSFWMQFKRITGLTPEEYRKKNKHV